ncbi:60S ribosomal protein L9 [Capsicum annuum]|nr:60S ribosomal protein L9 [Capsicum annuum]
MTMLLIPYHHPGALSQSVVTTLAYAKSLVKSDDNCDSLSQGWRLITNVVSHTSLQSPPDFNFFASILVGSLSHQLKLEETRQKNLKVDAWFGSRKTIDAIHTALSHVENLITSVTNSYRYKMRFVYAHFPINASITGGNKSIDIRNFLGEKKVRKVDMLEGVTVVRSEKVITQQVGILATQSTHANIVVNFYGLYTIGFQKRGLPYAHILLFLHPMLKSPTIDHVDTVIIAEIPNMEVDLDGYNAGGHYTSFEITDVYRVFWFKVEYEKFGVTSLSHAK